MLERGEDSAAEQARGTLTRRRAFPERAETVGKQHQALTEAAGRGRVVWLTGGPREFDVGGAVSVIGTSVSADLR